jgi:hypothetical protein
MVGAGRKAACHNAYAGVRLVIYRVIILKRSCRRVKYPIAAPPGTVAMA